MTSIQPTALLKGEGLPDFDKITPKEITENIPKLIKDLNEKLNKLEEQLMLKKKLYISVSVPKEMEKTKISSYLHGI